MVPINTSYYKLNAESRDKTGENYVTKIFIIYTAHQILVGLSDQRERDRWGLWNAGNRRETRMGVWVENLT
jgi:hypothetical protein